MTSKTITDRAGDTLRLSTGSLTAGPGEITIKVTERFRGREAVAAVHVDPAALRAALDEVAPLGKYTRTTPDPDDMDGGVAAALIEQEAEQCDAAESRPLTPDAITDEMVERGAEKFRTLPTAMRATDRVRCILTAALTEPPARPEWLDAPAVRAWHKNDGRTEHDGTPGKPRIWSPDYRTTETWSTPSLQNVPWADLVDVEPLGITEERS